MATRSFVGAKMPDGKVFFIYVHFDGDSLGGTLKEHYNSQAMANQLVSNGDASSIGESIDECVFYNEGSYAISPSVEAYTRNFMRKENRAIQYCYLYDSGWKRYTVVTGLEPV